MGKRKRKRKHHKTGTSAAAACCERRKVRRIAANEVQGQQDNQEGYETIESIKNLLEEERRHAPARRTLII